MARTAKPKPEIFAEVELAPDLHLHVRTTHEAGVDLIDIRQYVPSLKAYGRGITVPNTDDILVGVMDALDDIRRAAARKAVQSA